MLLVLGFLQIYIYINIYIDCSLGFVGILNLDGESKNQKAKSTEGKNLQGGSKEERLNHGQQLELPNQYSWKLLEKN